jgi:hypothetical protein
MKLTSFYIEDDAPERLVYGDGFQMLMIKLLLDTSKDPPVTTFSPDSYLMGEVHTGFGQHCNRKFFVIVNTNFDVYD